MLLLGIDPIKTSASGIDNHILKASLVNCRSLEIDYGGIEYRLVYRIFDKPSPRWVKIYSFAEHDAAYERAVERLAK